MFRGRIHLIVRRKLEPDSAICTVSSEGVLSVNAEVKAIRVTHEGSGTWSQLADRTISLSRFDGTHTHVLLLNPLWGGSDSLPLYTISGPFMETEGEVIAMDMSTLDGARVDVTIVEE
ncbi:MAG: hypothetical protein OEV49_13685 [candidate division Zixibacteria bacterium]|nr:hypothetical protein [candidate division Zixibacteria bacterium]MDH3937123.1 hypothetical protein [candidate division Zixibacteria bacterium]MDH4034596.1 hypothetical protein [candidate division Zixibacteria bacterium]